MLFCSFIFSCSISSDDISEQGSSAINGSYTKILAVNNRLYGVDDAFISTVDISIKDNPIVIDKQELGFGIESIYHYEGILLVGSNNRLFIMNLDERGVPVLQSSTDYVNFGDDVFPCDPVVANNTNAFVTLSENLTSIITACGNRSVVNIPIKELRIYDIVELKSPILMKTIPMHNPKGLSLDANYLFICNDDQGIVVFDVSDINNPIQIFEKTDFKAYDVIANKGLLIVVGDGQLYQFDYADISNISLLSIINI